MRPVPRAPQPLCKFMMQIPKPCPDPKPCREIQRSRKLRQSTKMMLNMHLRSGCLLFLSKPPSAGPPKSWHLVGAPGQNIGLHMCGFSHRSAGVSELVNFKKMDKAPHSSCPDILTRPVHKTMQEAHDLNRSHGFRPLGWESPCSASLARLEPFDLRTKTMCNLCRCVS